MMPLISSLKKGINVLIGKKTAILKLIYGALEVSMETEDECYRYLSEYFVAHVLDNQILINQNHHNNYAAYEVMGHDHQYTHVLYKDNVIFQSDNWYNQNISTIYIYIPNNAMLNNAKTFFAITYEENIPYKATQCDNIMKASYPEADDLSYKTMHLLNKISQIIDGTVIFKDDTFYFLTFDASLQDFALASQGKRKLGLLWRLLRNGSLETGSVLLWDDIEDGLNSELLFQLADILLDIQSNGVQIFITTHSYLLSKYLEINRTSKNQVCFHNLYSQLVTSKITHKTEKAVFHHSAYLLDDIRNNTLTNTYNDLIEQMNKQKH